jgi:formylglycine-generating enzyme required for sulfatase activity
VSRIFLSHSSTNNAEAVALRDWLAGEGFKDEIFLDLDPTRGIAAGERWERALNEAANRCEAVLFLLSKAWLSSAWCRRELNLAHRLNKQLFGVLIEELPLTEIPKDVSGDWQFVHLTSGRDHIILRAVLPITHAESHVSFSQEGLQRLKHGLERAGIDPKYFAWPPANDPERPPYRGLRSLEAEDAGIFFGRDAPVVEALDDLRGLREAPPPRVLVILGASGAGKSSFMRAGLLPRLARDDRHFLPLPIIRPGRAALFGDDGLLPALEGAFRTARIAIARGDLRAAIEGGAATLGPLLQTLAEKSTATALPGEELPRPPTLVVAIDQGEELFLAEGQDQARAFLELLRNLLCHTDYSLLAIFTIRSDAYEPLQICGEFEGVRQWMFNLPPMPRGSYAEVIKGPARRLEGSGRRLVLEDGLIEGLLADIEEAGGKDALALLAFTLERLYLEYGGRGKLKLADYRELKGIRGSIEAAVERALKNVDADPAIPKERPARLALLRRGLIPWLAGIDPDTGAPRRRVALQTEIPKDAQPLIAALVEQRLLVTDISQSGGQTIEPAHEALLRQWGMLQDWLAEDAGLLAVLEGVKRAARDWAQSGCDSAWLLHATGRLEAADRLMDRPDLAGLLEQKDRDYLGACRASERAAHAQSELAARNKKRLQTSIALLLCGIIVGLIGFINQDYLKEQWNWFALMRPYMRTSVQPYVLSEAAEHSLRPGSVFRECDKDCPEMVVVPAGRFMMGSPVSEKGHTADESPQHTVTISAPFAVSKFPVTFADWDACVAVGGCPQISVSGFGRGTRPAVNLSWHQTQIYVSWLSRMTGKHYRLLSEAEWEYAARAGSTTAYPWGEEIGVGQANCIGCGSEWDNKRTSPVGSFTPNAFGLYDTNGNVWQWIEDCYHDSYEGAPSDSSPWTQGCDEGRRAVRGGGWDSLAIALRTANRDRISLGNQLNDIGFRISRSLAPAQRAPLSGP